MITYSNNNEPKTYKEAINNTNKDKWYIAINNEIEELNKQNTWTLIDLPKDK